MGGLGFCALGSALVFSMVFFLQTAPVFWETHRKFPLNAPSCNQYLIANNAAYPDRSSSRGFSPSGAQSIAGDV